jgi:chromosomal replication initiator protein
MTRATDAQIWGATLGELQADMTRENYDTWLRDAHVVAGDADDGAGETGALHEGTLTVGVPTAFQKDWLEHKLTGRIAGALERVGQGHRAIRYIVAPSTNGHGEGPATASHNAVSMPTRPQQEKPAMTLFPHTPSALLPDYVFETFIVGASNRLTYAAATAVADNPGQQWNPLFIWGHVGLGKTHLLHAIGHKVRQNFPDKQVVYTTSEKFTNELIQSFVKKDQSSIDDFRERYRSVDVLLIDDIQFLANKESTQEEFFHTFNELHQNQKQIVMTSDRKPNTMSTLTERLRSRFAWGLITEVDLPDFETRVAILRTKAERQNVPVQPAAIEYIARRAGQSNIRELEGTLKKVIHTALTMGVPVTDKLAAEALDTLAPAHKRKVTAPEVLKAVAQYYQTEIAVLESPARDKAVSLPRHVSMYLMREETDASLPGIGQLLGGRDHSTIMHGCAKIARELKDENARLRSDIQAIRALLYASG